MIEKIKITNFKSIEELELNLGRVNVLIGENGCGKTNILEAIGFGSLAIERDFSLMHVSFKGIRFSTNSKTFSRTSLNDFKIIIKLEQK